MIVQTAPEDYFQCIVIPVYVMGEMKELFHIRLDGAAILGYCEEFLWVRGNAVHLLLLVRSSVTEVYQETEMLV